MKSVTQIAEFIAARKEISDLTWQIFDLSAAKDMTDEMLRQYTANEGVRFSSPIPAQNCVFFDGECAIIATGVDGEVECMLAEELEAAALQAYNLGKAQEVIDWCDADPTVKERMRLKLGAEEADKILSLAKSRVDRGMDTPKYANCMIGEYTDEVLCQAVAVFSEFVSYPIAQSKEVSAARPTRRRLKRLGVNVRILSVGLSPASVRYEQNNNSPLQKRALHFCRGHWRRSASPTAVKMPNGECGIWIDGHWRGDPEYGIVLHDYVAKLSDLDHRSKLIT